MEYFDNSAEKFELLLKENCRYKNAQYYLGMSNLKAGLVLNAIKHL